jgi:hypothetical protein
MGNNTDWVQFARVRIVKILVSILVLFLAVIILVGTLTNKPIDVWGLKFNMRDTAVKYVTIHDTPVNIKHDISQKIESGASGIQNNAPNYGNQAGGNMAVSSEPALTKDFKHAILNKLHEYAKIKNNPYQVLALKRSPNCNALKFTSELRLFLNRSGYEIKNVGGTYDIIQEDGILFTIEDRCILIVVGVLGQPPYSIRFSP